ncbi:MAG: hypothetical protein U0V56_03300 [Actinomycetota bacterium]
MDAHHDLDPAATLGQEIVAEDPATIAVIIALFWDEPGSLQDRPDAAGVATISSPRRVRAARTTIPGACVSRAPRACPGPRRIARGRRPRLRWDPRDGLRRG